MLSKLPRVQAHIFQIVSSAELVNRAGERFHGSLHVLREASHGIPES
jgi:hypothetical protein